MKPKFYFAPDDSGGGSGGENDDDPTGDGGGNQPPEGAGSGTPGEGDLVSRDELSKVNREAAKYRRERNDLQRQLQEIKDAEKSDLERMKGDLDTRTKDLDKAHSEIRTLRVQVLAEKVGIAPSARKDAAKLLDWDSMEDPDDAVIVEEALKTLVKDRPYLRGVHVDGADGGAGAGGEGPVGAGMNAAIRRASGRR
jgi:SMC interacting uncharacterized protein involved in chromosome segregation